MHAHAVRDVDRLVGVVDPDVDMDAEQELLANDELEAGDEVAVAVDGNDPLVLPHRERVRAGRPDAQVERGGGALDRLPQRAELISRLRDAGARDCGDLADRLHQLVLDLAVDVGGRLEQGVDRVRQLEGLGIEDHQLLLDADRVGRPGEPMFHSRHRIPLGESENAGISCGR